MRTTRKGRKGTEKGKKGTHPDRDGDAGGGRRGSGTRTEGRDPRDGYVNCPECGKSVKDKNIEPHLRRVHGLTPKEAAGAARSLMEGEEKGGAGRRTGIIFFVAMVVVIVAIIAFVVVNLLPGHEDGGDGDGDKDHEEVMFVTEDGWDLHGDYYNGNASRPAVVLVHGMNEERSSYKGLALELNAAGLTVLAYDSRGLGESKVKDGSIGALTKEEVQAGTKDITAAIGLLERRGTASYGVIVVGASVGANNAAVLAQVDGRVKALVLLSPGEDYQGIMPMDAIKAYDGSILFAASVGDDYAYGSCLEFYDSATRAERRDLYETTGFLHGTGLLADEGMKDKVIAWILSSA